MEISKGGGLKTINRVILGILDGWGVGPIWGGNAISQADTPNFHYLWNHYPHTILQASGKAVGLPSHEMGNSEVGHLTIGAGRVIPQDVSRINREIDTRRFFHNPVLLETIRYCQTKHRPLHLLGLLSRSSVHASIKHLMALLDLCRLNNFHQVYAHLITDGRDSPPKSALELLEKVEGRVKIASIGGRYYAMDRDNHWDRTKKYFRMLTRGNGERASSPRQAIAQSYQKGISDEFIKPVNIIQNHSPIALIKPRDGVIFFNFRQDRARQLSQILVQKNPTLRFISFVPYRSTDLPKQIQTCFKIPKIRHHLAQILSDRKMSQIHIAETEKYAHVTYFFNGGTYVPLADERRIVIDSFPADTFDKYPQMKAPEIADAVIKSIRQRYAFILFNFANADMVGHTGKMEAIIDGVEAVDKQLGKIFQVSQKLGYNFIITADHGNAEEMVDPLTGEPNTHHTVNPVPFILIASQENSDKKLRQGSLADIAPTILDIMGIERPREMNGKTLILNENIKLE